MESKVTAAIKMTDIFTSPPLLPELKEKLFQLIKKVMQVDIFILRSFNLYHCHKDQTYAFMYVMAVREM